MGKFAGKNRVPVTIDGDPNTIWVVDKLNYGMRQRVISAMAHISAETGHAVGRTDVSLNFDVGAFNIAVAQVAIVGWEGPDFEGVELTRDSVLELDYQDPLVKRALEMAGGKASAALEVDSPNSETPPSSGGEGDSPAAPEEPAP
jgi:hypothetical protein